MSSLGESMVTARFFERVDAALQRGVTVLTGSARVARLLAARYDEQRRDEGKVLWQPAKVLPWRAWCASLWQGAQITGVEQRVLLNSLQERAIWERVLRAEHADSLRPFASLARLCAGANGLLGAYDTEYRFARGVFAGDASSADADTFARWHARFQTVCEDGGYLPAAFLELELAHLLRAEGVSLPGAILLYGLEELTPAQVQVVDALRGRGVGIDTVTAAVERRKPATLLAAESSDAELLRCAVWMRRELEVRPESRIALLVPDLEDCRPELVRTLRGVLAPELADVSLEAQGAPFEVNAGRPLASLPLIADALRVLRLCVGEISLEEMGLLLRSPYCALAPSTERGAELDAFHLQREKTLRGEVSLQRVAGLLQRFDAVTALMLRELEAAAAKVRRGTNTHAFFAEHARALLLQAKWAQGTELSGEEQQAVTCWEEVLDRVATLDLFSERMVFSAFVRELSQAAHEAVFAPETVDAPVQVLRVGEADGLTFDAVWFLHADESVWPPRRTSHPLLPLTLQRSLGMPGTDVARDEGASARLLDRLIAGAGESVFSYAAQTVEGAQRPAAMIAARAMPVDEDMPVVADDDTEHVDLMEVLDDVAPLPALPQGIVPGGVGVLTAQAQCGFRAFAEKRLFSTEMQQREAGLTQGERGEQVHNVLQGFWDDVKDHATLVRLSSTPAVGGGTERDRKLRGLIAAEIASASSHGWESAYLTLQGERLFRLLSEWLDREMERPAFEVIATEKTVDGAVIGPLHLKLRVDRMDRVTGAGDGTVLIDYKTGKAERNDWIGDRLDAPQLPVYAVSGAIEDVEGIAFGGVRVGKDGMKFQEMLANAALLNRNGRARKDFDFGEQMETWRHDLEALAHAYAAGEAAVEPKDYLTTCKTCANRILCRLNPLDLQPDEELETEDEEELPTW